MGQSNLGLDRQLALVWLQRMRQPLNNIALAINQRVWQAEDVEPGDTLTDEGAQHLDRLAELERRLTVLCDDGHDNLSVADALELLDALTQRMRLPSAPAASLDVIERTSIERLGNLLRVSPSVRHRAKLSARFGQVTVTHTAPYETFRQQLKLGLSLPSDALSSRASSLQLVSGVVTRSTEFERVPGEGFLHILRVGAELEFTVEAVNEALSFDPVSAAAVLRAVVSDELGTFPPQRVNLTDVKVLELASDV